MQNSTFIRHFLLAFTAGAFAAKPLEREVCAASCYYSLAEVKYAGENETEQVVCTNPLRITSTYFCMGIHCEEADVKPGIAWWEATCKKSEPLVNEQAYRAAMSNITSAELASLPTVDWKEKDSVKGMAVPSSSSWLVVHRSVSTYDTNRAYNNRIRWIPYGFWAIVLLVGIANNALGFVFHGQYKQRPDSESRVSRQKRRMPQAFSKAKSCITAHLTLPPTFSLHHHQPWGWFTIPLRLQSMAIVSYVIIHIALLSVHYRIYDENSYYTSRRSQVLRYLADRLGTILASTLPLMFLFGGRGNIFIPLTGWSYRTFNVFHRWIARVFLIEVILHGVIFSAFDVNEGGWDKYHSKLRSDEIYLYGILMGAAIGLSTVLAHSQVRKRIYEFFKATHVILAAVLLAAFYQHVKTQFRGSYLLWEWLCVGVWVGDRVSRIIRVLIINYRSIIGKDTRALASFSEETGMIRLQVYPSMASIRQSPGTYYYLSFPGWRFWETHPFSLAGWSAPATDKSAPCDVDEKTGASSPQVGDITPEADKTCLTFMIRPRNGMTRRLRDKLYGQGQLRLRVLLEGPYGSGADLGKFDDILFIAGGSGITAVLPYVRTLLEGEDDPGNVPNVKLAWVARDEGFVRDVLANDLRQTKSSSFAAVKLTEQFFITSDGTESDQQGRDANNTPEIIDTRFTRSRPDVKSLVDNFLQEAEGRPAVFVCGPEGMADSTRAAVVKQIKNGAGDVEFFEELYGW